LRHLTKTKPKHKKEKRTDLIKIALRKMAKRSGRKNYVQKNSEKPIATNLPLDRKRKPIDSYFLQRSAAIF